LSRRRDIATLSRAISGGVSLVVALTPALALAPQTTAAQELSIFSVLDTQGRSVAPATPADGALTDGDVLSAGGRRVQVWSLSAAQGSSFQVDLRSVDFDSFLYIVGPGLGEGLRDDDGGDGLNSRLCVALDEVGEYRIVASSLTGETGMFTLEVSAVPGAANGMCTEAVVATEEVSDVADLPTNGRTLAVGDEATGMLSLDDPLLFDSPVQAWAVEGQAGESFSVDLISDAFDAYLIVAGPGLESWLLDDDGAGRCDSRVSFDFPQTGTYRVIASTIDVGGTGGPFRLVTSQTPGPVNPNGCMAMPADDATGPDEDTEIDEAGSLSFGLAANGAMTGNEGVYEGHHVQGWTLDASAGDRLSVELRSADFDSYLYFTGAGFESALWDDDGAGNLHSRICVEVPESGTYRVLAGVLSGASTGGRFTLTATLEGEGSLCDSYEVSPAVLAQTLAALPTEGRSISVGQELYGSIDLDAIRHPESDQLIQPWSLTLDGQMVFVDVESNQFDPLLYAVGGGIEGSLFIDDAGDGCNTRMQIGPGVSGTVTLLVGSFYEAATGDFLLRASENPPTLASGGCVGADAGSTGGALAADASVLSGLSSGVDLPLEIGTEADGSLDSSETLQGGQPAQSWSVMVQAGDELVFELFSDDFDAVLYLDGVGLSGPLTDDDGGGGLNSRTAAAGSTRESSSPLDRVGVCASSHRPSARACRAASASGRSAGQTDAAGAPRFGRSLRAPAYDVVQSSESTRTKLPPSISRISSSP